MSAVSSMAGVTCSSQWSLTFEVRKRFAGLAPVGAVVDVAMEPDL